MGENQTSTPPLNKDGITVYTDPHVASWLADMAKKSGLLPKTENGVGNISMMPDVLMSYSLTYGHVITVTANKTGDDEWQFTGVIDGKRTITGTVFGGKWRAVQYIKFIRNGILSRSLKKSKANKANKEG